MTSAVADSPSDTAKKSTEGKRYLILGCGPAGMIAAYTLVREGVNREDIEIVSLEKEQSPINGAQFLHQPITCDPLKPDGFLSVLHLGFPDIYANKVYGDGAKPTSFDQYRSTDTIAAWSLQKEYDKLWSLYSDLIVTMTVNSGVFKEFLKSGEYCEIISTIPPSAYCWNPTHTFPFAPIALGEPLDEVPMDNYIIYNGRADDSWYRLSSIFGNAGIEFGLPEGDLGQKADKAARAMCWEKPADGKKPLGTNCDCGYDKGSGTNLLRVGRFGLWDRKRLLHTIPAQVSEIL